MTHPPRELPSSPSKARILPFSPEWQADCLTLIADLTPEHFSEADRVDFDAFLLDLPGPYSVVVEGTTLVGCGGVALEPGGLTATLCWGMVAPSRQRQGIGTLLTDHRVSQARALGPHVRWLQVNTSQKVEGFYATHGFKAVDRHVDAFAPGLDHVHMRRDL